jgi:hypothetical protein
MDQQTTNGQQSNFGGYKQEQIPVPLKAQSHEKVCEIMT